MGVLLAHSSVGRPARVADPGSGNALDLGHGPRASACHTCARAWERVCGHRHFARLARGIAVRGRATLLAVLELGFKRAQIAYRAHRFDAIARDERNPGTVIAAVLELLQAGEQQLAGRALAYIANDAAHRADDISQSQAPFSQLVAQPGSGVQPNSCRTSATRREQTASVSLKVGASTMTRTSGSVPLGRTSTRPRPASARSSSCTASATLCDFASAPRSPTRTLTSFCGSLRIASRSLRSRPASASSVS